MNTTQLLYPRPTTSALIAWQFLGQPLHEWPTWVRASCSLLRGEDGTMSHAPAFLQSAPRAEATEDEPAEARRPRRRRAPRTFEPGQAAPAEVDEG